MSSRSTSAVKSHHRGPTPKHAISAEWIPKLRYPAILTAGFLDFEDIGHVI